jgi:uncharacterized membrane protein
MVLRSMRALAVWVGVEMGFFSGLATMAQIILAVVVVPVTLAMAAVLVVLASLSFVTKSRRRNGALCRSN